MLVNYNKLAEYNQKKSLESSKLFENYKNNLLVICFFILV